MKLIIIYILFTSSIILTACNPNNINRQFGPAQAMIPQQQGPNALLAGGNRIPLVAQNVGSISNLNVQAIVPPGNTDGLLDYLGPLQLVGQVTTQGIACFGNIGLPINCQAVINVRGNIEANNCNINGQSVQMRLFLRRSTRSIGPNVMVAGAELNPLNSNCLNQSNQGVFPVGIRGAQFPRGPLTTPPINPVW